ncbi:FRG domain-containing protein [Ferribacterium limneticum]|uniref:FRG domain-containing protein n=1 Tax=Ferribacterium limneticum TaxID=76259 RepID=UPI001CF826AC|nr:FRG domain-containing protein [Ferribacterium limneticum]UCV23685.1 FRG domain-containing protein [Ferribacterium limneticum]
METHTIKNWGEFDKLVGSKNYRKWIFRGQSNANFELESSLARAFKDAQSIHKAGSGEEKNLNKREHEKVMIDRFKCNAHLFLNHLPEPDDDLSWLSIMQHHGAPTRLLDFTFSPYIALYFALEDGTGDAAVYVLNHHALIAEDDEYFGTRRLEVHSKILDGAQKSEDMCLFAFEPTFSNHRLLSQQGLFVTTNTLEHTHERILKEYTVTDGDFTKLIIPARLRLTGLRKLNQMNINAANIYPGLDGFCKSMKRQPIFGLQWQKRVGNSG